MALDPVANFGKCTVSGTYISTDITVNLNTGDGAKLPQPSSAGAFNLVWWNFTDYPDPADDPSKEIVRVTARTNDQLTVTRAQEGTSASNKNTAAKVYKMALALTAKMITDIQAQTANGVPVENEVVSGSGTSFTLANTPVSGSVKVWGAGIRLTPGAGNDYTITGSAITTTTSYP